MDKEEKSRLPSWLTDKKKLIILIALILAMVFSFINTTAIFSSIANSKYVKNYLGFNDTSYFEVICNNLFTRNKLSGYYVNDNAAEALEFFRDGRLKYYISLDDSNPINGEYVFDKGELQLTIDGEIISFDVLNNTNEVLVLSNGFNMFSFTKTEK